MSRALTSPQVYRAINAITADFAQAGIAKAHTNLVDQYQYRSIDDVLNRLAPLLARHRLCVLPRVLKRRAEDRAGDQGSILVSVRLKVAFDLVSARDGSSHTVQSWGEALDPGDKGTAKAMSAAYKSAMLELFCVPVTSDDADASSHRLKACPPRGRAGPGLGRVERRHPRHDRGVREPRCAGPGANPAGQVAGGAQARAARALRADRRRLCRAKPAAGGAGQASQASQASATKAMETVDG